MDKNISEFSFTETRHIPRRVLLPAYIVDACHDFKDVNARVSGIALIHSYMRIVQDEKFDLLSSKLLYESVVGSAHGFLTADEMKKIK